VQEEGMRVEEEFVHYRKKKPINNRKSPTTREREVDTSSTKSLGCDWYGCVGRNPKIRTSEWQ